MADVDTEKRLEQIVRARLRANKPQIEHSIRQIAFGNPLGAEMEPERSVARIAAKARLPARDAEAMSSMIVRAANAIESTAAATPEGLQELPLAEGGPEARQGPTIDFVGVEFLTRGRLAANAVGRVVFRSGRAEGTGFLVGGGLFITNNHVIKSAQGAAEMVVEFDYESAATGGETPITIFEFDPARCFVFDPINRLDFTLIAIGKRVSGSKSLDAFGHLPLSDAADKHMLGEIANIIQHPQGRFKQIVLRENNLVSRDETNEVLHYIADTEKGSSGSPVCNNDWEPIALHHWGGPGLEVFDVNGQPLRRDINEGIRVSAIVRALRERAARLDPLASAAVTDVLRLWKELPRPGPVAPEKASPDADERPAHGPRLRPDGSVSWVFPVEISVRAPLSSPPAPAVVAKSPLAVPVNVREGAERGRRDDIDFGDRGGYERGFIPGFDVPLPKFPSSYPLARNLQARGDDDRHELRYNHFSIFMNSERRLAALTACNIDGSRVVAVDREDKTVKRSPTLRDLGVESLGAEASDDFTPDPRVPEHQQMAIEFYEDQKVPGFEKPEFPGPDASEAKKKAYHRAMRERTARMFQKGHIIMRGDPAWGGKTEALAAEEDTFFYTNAAPQLGYFNQGSGEDQPGAKGKLRWRAVETYVLRNAVTMRQRISVFAGPIFDDANDPNYRFDAKVPMCFWKIAVWAEDGELRAIALIADQRPVLDNLTQGVPEGMEAFGDEEELARVTQFLTTVGNIEQLTGIDFGDAIRSADLRAGAESRSPVTSASAETLRYARRRPVPAAPDNKRKPRS